MKKRSITKADRHSLRDNIIELARKAERTVSISSELLEFMITDSDAGDTLERTLAAETEADEYKAKIDHIIMTSKQPPALVLDQVILAREIDDISDVSERFARIASAYFQPIPAVLKDDVHKLRLAVISLVKRVSNAVVEVFRDFNKAQELVSTAQDDRNHSRDILFDIIEKLYNEVKDAKQFVGLERIMRHFQAIAEEIDEVADIIYYICVKY